MPYQTPEMGFLFSPNSVQRIRSVVSGEIDSRRSNTLTPFQPSLPLPNLHGGWVKALHDASEKVTGWQGTAQQS